MLKKYLFLTKPGILFGNFITTLGGFFLAAQGHVDFLLLILTLLGTTFVVASGCVVNNVIDQDIDQKMERTQNRALVKKNRLSEYCSYFCFYSWHHWIWYSMVLGKSLFIFICDHWLCRLCRFL